MTLETAVSVWQQVAEWERVSFGAVGSSLSFPAGPQPPDYELRVPTDGPRHGADAELIDLVALCDIAAAHGAALLLHSSGGLVIR